MTDKIDKDVARVEFDRFADANDLDLDTEGMDENERRDTEGDIRRIVRGIVRGTITVDQDGVMEFTPTKKQLDKPIRFSETRGASLLEMDKKKQHADVGKLYASLGSLTKTPAVVFSKMDLADLKVCMAVYTLLMV